MHLYLPIAKLSVNALFIILLSGGVGLLSGMPGTGTGNRNPLQCWKKSETAGLLFEP